VQAPPESAAGAPRSITPTVGLHAVRRGTPLQTMTVTTPPPGPHAPPTHPRHFWLAVMCLTGVDYFSTLGYQPSIAFNNAGLLSPLATMVLVFVTLFGALPVYRYVAERSPHGQGSISMLERLVGGWTGKVVVLVLVGFAMTAFVITKTLSAADAAEHLLNNPYFKGAPDWMQSQMGATMTMLVLLGVMFLRSFREVIGAAAVLVAIFLALNLVVIAESMRYLFNHFHLVEEWWANVVAGRWYIESVPLTGGSGLGTAILASMLIFPGLALGLSGFETGVAVMPLVKGDPGEREAEPTGRIRNTKKLLTTAAAIMSFYLIGSSIVTTTLIPPQALKEVKYGHGAAKPTDPNAEGAAANRALAYIANGEASAARGETISPIFGRAFGLIYDLSTIAILWFAGASAMAALLNLLPEYLPRYGMAPDWARAIRPLVILFTIVNLVVTWAFGASVEAQGAAYATGVLVLISSACVASAIDKYKRREGPWWRRVPLRASLIVAIFAYTTTVIIIGKPDGLQIAILFIIAVVGVSMVSRAMRSTELRFGGFEFKDETTRLIWDDMKAYSFPILVPHRPGARSLEEKEAIIRMEHRLQEKDQIVFIEAELGDVSDFEHKPMLEVAEQGDNRIVLRATRCASIPHVIAAIGLEMSKSGTPPEIHFGWSNESPLAASLSFVLFGQGNVPWMVRELILKNEPDADKQPRVVVG
jgi:hypothetical protein